MGLESLPMDPLAHWEPPQLLISHQGIAVSISEDPPDVQYTT